MAGERPVEVEFAVPAGDASFSPAWVANLSQVIDGSWTPPTVNRISPDGRDRAPRHL